MNRRRLFGMVGALALAGVMGIGAAAEKLKAATAMACCCGDSCCCGDDCADACCCGPVCCGDSCCCDSTWSNTATIKTESCRGMDVDASASCCPVTNAKVAVIH